MALEGGGGDEDVNKSAREEVLSPDEADAKGEEDEPLIHAREETPSEARQIPIMVTLDPSDRTSLHTGSTLSVRTSPNHVKAPSRSSIATAAIPMHPPPPISHEDALSIHVAETKSKKSSEGSSSDLSSGFCSLKALCGPHPKKVTIVVALILSIWGSIVLGVNVHKKVITMEDKLLSMKEKMVDLQIKYLADRERNSQEIAKLHQRLEAKSFTKSYREEAARRPKKKSAIAVSKRSRISSSSSTTSTTSPPTVEVACKTVDGASDCIFPFKYEGLVHTGCVQKWTDTRPWCPTQVDEDGAYVRFKGLAWNNCDASCPMTKAYDTLEDTTAW